MKVLIVLLGLLFSMEAYSQSLMGRLGIGMSNQVVSGIQTLSLKLQRDPSQAFGAVMGLDSSSNAALYATGAKYYKLIYLEPQLNFYMTGAFFLFNELKEDNRTKTIGGHQIELNFGSEFHFQGLESVGFSFEFGLGHRHSQGNTRIVTTAHHLLQAGIHFYL